MKLLVVSGMFPPMRTGTAFYSLNLAEALVELGHEVEIVSLGEPSFEQKGPVNIHRLPAIQLPLAGFFKHFRICALNPRNWVRMARIFRRSNADAVLLVNHYLDIAFPTILASKLARLPLFCSVGTQLQSLNPRRNKILNILDRLICGGLIFPFCFRIVAWDNQIRQYLLDVQGARIDRKISIVHYGVNGVSGHLESHDHNYDSNDVILGVGAVSEQRSFVPLVRAFATLADARPKLRLRIIGHVYYPEAQRLAAELGLSERVEFLGERSHDEVVENMRAASVLFSSLTGKYVGLGTATIEAMLSGLPTVVNTPLDLFGEVRLKDGLHLVQCQSSEPAVIAERLASVIDHRDARARIGQGGRDFVKTHLNWPVVARNMATLLASYPQGKQ